MKKILILILLIWPNFSIADEGIEITCVNMKSALFGRKYKPLNFKLEATAFHYFDDEKGKMNLSILDTKGSLLVVSQFTLCGDIKKGRRPSFVNAESPKLSLKIYENLMADFCQLGIKTLGGVFGEMMNVELVNEGPATFIINSKEL